MVGRRRLTRGASDSIYHQGVNGGGGDRVGGWQGTATGTGGKAGEMSQTSEGHLSLGKKNKL